jgi:UDP:flavonoid glycosyltransferase YjiC (YdhE family)
VRTQLRTAFIVLLDQGIDTPAMRVLFTTSPALGHFHPLVPLARSLESAGHLAAFASLPNFSATVETCGFRFFPVGPHVREIHASPEMREYASLTDPIARRELIRRRVATGLLPRAILPDLMAWCESWAPDLIITENYEFAGRVAAERQSIPHATLKVGDVYRYAKRHAVVQAMDELRGSVGLPSDPDGAMLFRYLYLINEPASLASSDELPPTAFRCRRVVFDQSGDAQYNPPRRLAEHPSQPTVYATAGTAVNQTPKLLETFATALQGEGLNAVLTIGPDRDPSEFAWAGPNVQVERYVPESRALPTCDAVLSHCGSGTMYAALDFGLPMVNVPIGMDQPENAARCAAAGVGVTVDVAALSVDSVRNAVHAVLHDPSYRTNAQRVRQEMHSLPDPREVVTLLEDLANQKQPLQTTRRS